MLTFSLIICAQRMWSLWYQFFEICWGCYFIFCNLLWMSRSVLLLPVVAYLLVCFVFWGFELIFC